MKGLGALFCLDVAADHEGLTSAESCKMVVAVLFESSRVRLAGAGDVASKSDDGDKAPEWMEREFHWPA